MITLRATRISCSRVVVRWMMVFAVCTASVLAAANTTASGPVAYYPFNGSTEDASGWGNHAVNMGAMPTVDRHGNPAGAYVTGAFGHLEAPDSDSLDFSGAVTLATWFRFDDVESVTGVMVGKGMGTGYSVSVYYGGSYICPDPGALRQIQVTVEGCSNRFISGPVFDCGTGEWHHVAVVFVSNGPSDVTASLYADGAFGGSLGMSCPGAPNTMPLGIGADDEASLRLFAGALDDVRVFDRELTVEEITELYNSLFIDGFESGSTSSWMSISP